MDKLTSIIVDDSRLVREELKLLLEHHPEIAVVGEAATVDTAIKLIESIKPKVVFLDIQLKNETGFDLLEKTNIIFQTIFITAHDEYAIRAFEVNALDYLLKPLNPDRLSQAIARLLPEDETSVGPTEKVTYDDVLYLMINGSFMFVKVKMIKCIIAAGKYSYIYYGNRKNKELVSKTLREWEEILPDKYLIRIHRSTIVNFEYVENVKKYQNNTHEVTIEGIENPFIISRRYASKLKKMLKM
jgi:two-component system LytT family response regulator